MIVIQAYRHPPIHNPEQLCYGRFDIPLATDWQQSMRSAGLRQSDTEALIFTSPASRASSFAAWLWPRRIACVSPALSEMDFGRWEGRPWSTIAPSEVCHWQDDLWRHSAPEGESAQQVRARVEGFLRSLRPLTASLSHGSRLEAKPKPSVRLVTHHGILKTLVACAQGLSVEEMLAVKIPFGQSITLTWDHDQQALSLLSGPSV